MHLLITGYNGTVGRAVAAAAREGGHRVTGWDRVAAPPDDDAAAERQLATVRPDALLHLAIPSSGTGRPNEGWLVNVHWSGHLAHLCRQRGIRFLYASTVMVFTDHAKGPFRPEHEPDATEGYGGEKRKGEQAVAAANPDATIARLGWQIGHGPGGNNMIDFFVTKMRDEGVIHASRKWLPATSFVDDTAAALLDLVATPHPGIHHVNANDRWTFVEIARALNQRHGGTWRIEANDDFVYDQRMLDERVRIPRLAERLPELKNAAH